MPWLPARCLLQTFPVLKTAAGLHTVVRDTPATTATGAELVRSSQSADSAQRGGKGHQAAVRLLSVPCC